MKQLARLMLILLLVSLCSFVTGCASRTRGEEPLWDPEVRLFDPDPKGCAWVLQNRDDIPCADIALFDYTIIHLDKIEEIDLKFGRCESWR